MPLDLLQRAAAGGDAEEVRAALEAATRAANERLWVLRSVARLYVEVLGDAAAARHVLEALAPLTGGEWRLVAAGWAELGDVARATSCLERAAHNARTARDLCTVALGYHDIGFPDEARLLVAGAEAIAARGVEWWGVATVFELLGDRAAAVAALEHALGDAAAVEDRLVLVHALAAFEAPEDRLRAALAEAERRASTVRDWVELGTTHYFLELDDGAAERCGRAASALATSPDHERAIAEMRCRGIGLPLLDDERPRLAPDALLRPGARALGWERDPARLLAWLRARLPPATIDAMTAGGDRFTNDDRIALLEIVKHGTIPHPLPAYLERLGTFAREDGPGVDHLRRAFACTLVCLDDAVDPGSTRNATLLPVLLESCAALGSGALEGAAALCAALADSYAATHSTRREAYLVLFAELALVLAAAALDASDPRIALAEARLVRDERIERVRLGDPEGPWLLALGGLDAATIARWRALAAALLVHPRHRALAERLAV